MSLLHTKMKIFYFKEKIDSLPRERKEVLSPIHIRIKPTNACNHNCHYCAYRSENLQLGQDMRKKDFIPDSKMKEIIEDISEMGVRAVTFSGGGEPFCYPYLLDAVKKLIKTDIKFAALTNGSLLRGEIAEIFAHKATWLRVSMDGWDNESYSRYRKVDSAEFTKVMNNIEGFKKIGGKCYLGVVLIVDKNNAARIYRFVKRLKDTGVDNVKISPCIISNDGLENNQYHSLIFSKVKEQIKKVTEDLVDDRFKIFDAYGELADKFKKEYTWCPYLQIQPVIGADLNIYSCHDKAYNLREGLIGSIKSQRFKDFWFSDKIKFFKINPSIHCSHHCVVNAQNKIILDYLDTDREHLEFV